VRSTERGIAFSFEMGVRRFVEGLLEAAREVAWSFVGSGVTVFAGSTGGAGGEGFST
jgi:hypothetical protein